MCMCDGDGDGDVVVCCRGACGEVKLAFDKNTCQRFAVKIINKKTFSVGVSYEEEEEEDEEEEDKEEKEEEE